MNQKTILALAALLALTIVIVSGFYFFSAKPRVQKPVQTATSVSDIPASEAAASEGIPAAEDVVSDWMASASHRKNILTGGFTDVGAAVVTSRGTDYVVAYFGAPPQAPAGTNEQAVIALLNQLIALYAELIRLMSATS